MMSETDPPTITVRHQIPSMNSNGNLRPNTVIIKNVPEVQEYQNVPAVNYTVQPTPNPDSTQVVVILNPSYFHTWPGILKLFEVFLAIICMACASPAVLPGTSWFLFVVVTSFIITILWIFIHLLSLQNSIQTPVALPWLSVEFWYNAGVTVLYTTAFITQLAVWSQYPFVVTRTFTIYRDSNIAAGCFGLFNTIVYGIATFLLHRERQASQ